MTTLPQNPKPHFETPPKLPRIDKNPVKKKKIKHKLKALIRENKRLEANAQFSNEPIL